MKTCFIGHRWLYVEDIFERIKIAVMLEMIKGCKSFIMGTHGDFDSWALAACRHLRKMYKDMDIEVVITSKNALKKSNDEYRDNQYDDVKTVTFDIDEAHYKSRITLSNRKMIDQCDTLICYVDDGEYRSGARTAMRYAKKKGLRIVNLYREEGDPFYTMSREEKIKLLIDFMKK